MNLDFRERALIERLPEAQVKSLVLGDIVIEQDGVERVIIERKTGSDLSSSICDGRYREQSERLAACGLPPRDVIYLIEGSLDGHTIPKQTLLAALVSLSHRLGFTVMRTESVDESVEYLQVLQHKLETPSTASTVVKRAKKDSITPANIAALMLAQIPSVSITTATQLLQGRTIAQFSIDLQADPGMLKDVLINKRRVPATTVQRIKQFLGL